MELSLNEIRLYMPSGDFARGYGYFKSNFVRKCLVRVDTAEKVLINGAVQGSNGNTYSQTINISKKNRLC